MLTHTTTAQFKAPKDTVFAYISDIETLPKWATAFCKGLRKEGDDYIVQTDDGDMYFRIDSDPVSGVIDMVAGPTKDMMGIWPGRVVSLSEDETLFMLTAVQTPGAPDEQFEGECSQLDEEFENIRKAVE